MKSFIKFCLFVGVLFGLVFVFQEDISNFIYNVIVTNSIKVSELEPNDYYRKNNYSYVQITDDFVAKNRQHLMNIYYTAINSGANEFTFRCDRDYKECLDDVEDIAYNQAILSNINSFIHPYNSFSSIETKYSNLGKVVISVHKSYTDGEIKAVNDKVQEIVKNNLNTLNNDRDIIKGIHDYVINNTKYDKDRSDKKIVKYKSDTAYGALIEGYALCGGYTDAMFIFLDYYGINNYKVISENHIWNAVEIDGKWYHLDLTWDDPINDKDKDILEYTFFLITDEELNDIETDQHRYDKKVFKEVSVQRD